MLDKPISDNVFTHSRMILGSTGFEHFYSKIDTIWKLIYNNQSTQSKYAVHKFS